MSRTSSVQIPRQPSNPRLVRNLLAMRMQLTMDQMRTGKWSERIDEIDEALGELGHDMKSTAACAADGVRRSFLLSGLAQRARGRRAQPA